MIKICDCCYPKEEQDKLENCPSGCEALAKMYLSKGCHAYHDAIYLNLCGSHLAKIQPNESIYLVESYVLETERLPGGPYSKFEDYYGVI